ncbi:class I adenylate-forming enzyme family protein [Mycolicibacterium vinylchloridicum]|uniref:class I adenylate-forming enzyme family protein n=1 Tax=Mycolicibacterium vinylchloridicum TaxID=2736928 RepID=UPI0015CABC5C|nr:AMP-binding protein [Mycolicibacterium vinylchloridicum]
MAAESSEAADNTYWNLVDDAARSRPSHVVLSDDYGRELTTRDLRDAGLQTAAALAERGVTGGTVVSWQLPTTLETMVVMVALSRLGAVQNPILPIWRKNEVTHALSQIGAQVYIVPRAWRGYDHAALAQQMSQSHGTRAVVLDFDGPPANLNLRLPTGEPDQLGPVPTSSRVVRWIYYSSGTTSAPKGIQHSDATIIAGTSGILNLVGTVSDDIYPIAFPVSHIGGAATLAAALITGMRLVLFDAFDPATTPFAMAAHRPTLLGSATPFFAAYLAAQDRHGTQPLFGELRGCTGGGAPITAELAQRVRDGLGVPGIANAWGLTEFPVATTPSATAGPEVLDHTVGHPVAGVHVRVVGQGESDAEPGALGELRLKGPQCFLGYVDSTLDTDAFDADGWFRTGDQGCVDVDGNVRVTGRLKDAIIRNAENISAQEVEEAVATHAHVDDVAVIGVPDERTGERVCAIVVPTAGATVAVADLAAHCDAQGLSRYKWPERVELVDALPRNLTGKVLKAELRQRFS